MIPIGAVTGLIYLFYYFVSFTLCSDWLLWHYSDRVSVYIYDNLYVVKKFVLVG